MMSWAWAKLNTPDASRTMLYPMATRAYTAPTARPDQIVVVTACRGSSSCQSPPCPRPPRAVRLTMMLCAGLVQPVLVVAARRHVAERRDVHRREVVRRGEGVGAELTFGAVGEPRHRRGRLLQALQGGLDLVGV